MYQLDINKGDIILRGKYRNKKEVVKTFGHDDKGQPTINGKRILNFNIEKLMPQKEIKETMKKSELKNLIKECIQEQKLNEGIGVGGLLEMGLPYIKQAVKTCKDPKMKKELEKGFEILMGVYNKT